jgi:hypothetical protein
MQMSFVMDSDFEREVNTRSLASAEAAGTRSTAW